MNTNKSMLLEMIPYGKENAISMEQLAILLNEKERNVRAMIYAERLKGAVICSACSRNGDEKTGYYRPICPEEAKAYVDMQKSRIKSARQALKSAEKYIKGGGNNG
ncbi:MAG: hypothetical protein IKG98_12275 [Ruminococcus sp.]|nr:hypothetical protein [Ruminococcus sp.]